MGRSFGIKSDKRIAWIYADESEIEIEGKPHLIIGAIHPRDPGDLALRVFELKEKLGFRPFDEVKWNMKKTKATKEQRYALSNGILSTLMWGCTGLISIVEGRDRQRAVEYLALQICDYLKGTDAYILNLDEGLLPNPDAFIKASERDADMSPRCIGIQNIDSSKDQVLQACDIFVGSFRAAIWSELSGTVKTISWSDDEHDEITLTSYVHLGTRHLMWGKMEGTPEDIEQGLMPFKHSLGLGFRIQSTVSQETRKKLESFTTVYMGCLS